MVPVVLLQLTTKVTRVVARQYLVLLLPLVVEEVVVVLDNQLEVVVEMVALVVEALDIQIKKELAREYLVKEMMVVKANCSVIWAVAEAVKVVLEQEVFLITINTQ